MNAHKSHENGKIFIYFCIQIYYLYKSDTHTHTHNKNNNKRSNNWWVFKNFPTHLTIYLHVTIYAWQRQLP